MAEAVAEAPALSSSEWDAPPRSCRQVDSSLSSQVVASIEHRARIWEVRKYCQLKPALAQYERGSDCSGGRDSHASPDSDSALQTDAALTALLRCLIYELDADLAMISLLDDKTQYFLAGASRDGLSTAKVTLESTRWYGCDFVLHHGGLCERTVTMRDLPAIYEELDMTENDQTRNLPFVNGTVADFRHYAGSPICSADGLVIGTVFTFSRHASPGLLQKRRRFLCDTSENIMRQLEQAERALEGSRASMFNSAVASLLEVATYYMHKFDTNLGPRDRSANTDNGHHTPYVLEIYRQAAELLFNAFELDGCRFQEILTASDISFPGNSGHRVLAQKLNTASVRQCEVPESTLQQLSSQYPHGAAFHLSDGAEEAIFMTAAGGNSNLLDRNVSDALRQSFPDAKQVMFMPLWDSLHNRTSAAAFGWSTSFYRVYTSKADLAQLSAFCTSVAAQVRRIESHVLDRMKVDFLGSVSHEMRSPLHGVLGSLELLTGTKCSREQSDLIRSARTGGNELLDNIDKILQFTEINATAHGLEAVGTPSRLDTLGITAPDSATDVEDETDLLKLCEKIIGRAVERTKTISLAAATTEPDGTKANSHPIVFTFDANIEEDRVHLTTNKAFSIVLENLLTNAVKYSGIDCCLRVNVTVEDCNLTVAITDCGRGIPKDFLQNRLYVPFSQVDQIDNGTGLGLPLVKRVVDTLKGNIRIDSNENIGTMAQVVLPLASLTSSPQLLKKPRAIPPQSHIPSPLQAQVFIPPVWASGIYGLRGERLVDNLLASLTRNLKALTYTNLKIWEPGLDTPDILFVRVSDLKTYEQRCGERYAHVKKVLIGAEPRPSADQVSLIKHSTVGEGPVVEILGPLVPTKLSNALHMIFSVVDDSNTLTKSTAALTVEDASSDTTDVSSGATEAHDNNTDAGHTTSTSSTSSESKHSSSQATNPTPCITPSREPRLLLVDDNAINVKLLRMYVKKCGINEPITASGGREAIAAHEEAVTSDHPFDICFMDLSMPEIDGFEATSTIRNRESHHPPSNLSQRLHVVALTGLVSSKDRHAAFVAGVDEYITKPAQVKDIAAVLDKWRGGLANDSSVGREPGDAVDETVSPGNGDGV